MSRLFSRRPSQPIAGGSHHTSAVEDSHPAARTWGGHASRQSTTAGINSIKPRDFLIGFPSHTTTPLIPPPTPSLGSTRPYKRGHGSKLSVSYSSRQAWWIRVKRFRLSRNTLLTLVNLLWMLWLFKRTSSPSPTSSISQTSAASLAASAPPSPASINNTSPVVTRAVSHKATDSCSLCVIRPDDPLCLLYGLDNIHLSRAYEGSGFRVRKVIEKALRGEEVTIGVLGASVTGGHGLPEGKRTWHMQFLKDFIKLFPKTKLFEGAAPGMNSAFFGFCFNALVPQDLDMYLIELDINNEAIDSTYHEDDILFRGLLNLPQQPAVLRVSVFALAFGDLARGTVSALIMSQYFDVPVISIRNFLLPQIMEKPSDTAKFFAVDGGGGLDSRHISWLGHQAMGDMLAIYMREQVCEVKRRKLNPLHTRSGDFASSAFLGRVPKQYIWNKYDPDAVAEELRPSCHMTGSSLSPLVPLESMTTSAWKMEEWNGKRAMASFQPGSSISFAFTGTKIGVFVWSSNGKNFKEPPGRARCWVDDMKKESVIVDAFIENEAATSRWTLLREQLSMDNHVLTCTILKESSTAGNDFRILGVGTQ